MAKPYTVDRNTAVARGILVALLCGMTAGAATICFNWLSSPATYIGSSMIVSAIITAVFDYGYRAGRKDAHNG